MAFKNPTGKIKIQKTEKHKKNAERYKAIPVDIREKFVEALEKNIFINTSYSVMLYCGLRIGETLSLTWRDINMEQKLINVRQAITQECKIDKMGKTIARKTIIASTKTACSVRIVPIPDKLIPILEKWKEERWVTGKQNGCNVLEPDSLVFGSNTGEVRTTQGTTTMFSRLMKQYGLSDYKLHAHSMRQTFSNILFENGVNPKVIQMLLGHKDVKTTIMNYNSVDQSYFEKTANIINGAI